MTGKTTHAYLFCGSRGTGKTSCAKILAKAINCLDQRDGNPCGKCSACLAIDTGSATDIMEMDAASNNGVDYIRDIREEVVYTPAMLKKRVYIIDEVHMLSQGAFNALLKTLEEPPKHVVFILATTELQKLPATITSRCQRFDFKRISVDDIAARLEFIASNENISLTHEAAKLIGRLSQGGMRDSISLLELCAGTGKTVDVKLVNQTAGATGRSELTNIIRAVLKKDYDVIFGKIAEFVASSVDLSVFWQELIGYYRDMLIIRSVKDGSPYLDLTNEEYGETQNLSLLFTKERLIYHIKLLENAYISMQRSGSYRRTCAEMTLVQMSEQQLDDSNEALLSRIALLEEKLAMGSLGIIPVPDSSKEEEDISLKNSGASSCENNVQSTISVKNQTEKKAIQCWAEIVKSLERSDSGAASVLRLAKGFIDGDGVKVIVSDRFSVMLLDNDEIKAKIALELNANKEVSGLSPQKIKFIVGKKEEANDDPIFSLNEN